LLLNELRSRPWLLVLDGLERVLVAYHRFDAAQLADEEAGTQDVIARRDPCSAIRPEDDELLRKLASAVPSKLLLTSRLIPRVLFNAAGHAIPGVRPVRLPGLRPADAEELLRSCGIRGTSPEIQTYLQSHCDCHPLVTGVLAGLINDFLPDRGNFDAWVVDRDGGAALNLADLDLTQKRNHILRAALDALPEESRQLLSTLALLSESVDYRTLSAFNPHVPPEPEEVDEPEDPQEEMLDWDELSDDEQKRLQENYQVALDLRKRYEQEMEARKQPPALLKARRELTTTVRDLERRGLLQYEAHARRYDLHPVVRGIAAGGLKQDERNRYGQRVVDYFSRQIHDPYSNAESLDDVRDGIHLVRTLLRMQRYEEAVRIYQGDLANALAFNLEAQTNILSLIRPFFPHGWSILPDRLSPKDATYLATHAGIALDLIGATDEALAAYGCGLQASLQNDLSKNVAVLLSNISKTLLSQNRLAAAERCDLPALDLSTLLADPGRIFLACFYRFQWLSIVGRAEEATELWQRLDSMGRDWPRGLYRPGRAEFALATFHFWQGTLTKQLLENAQKLAQAGKNRVAVRAIHRLRGEWQIEREEWALAAASLHEAVRMAREVQYSDAHAEVLLALANLRLGRLHDPRGEAEQLSQGESRPDEALASLWLATNDREQATRHALAAYETAWADGEPFVHRHALNKARALLEQLGAEIPVLPPYDPVKDQRFAWEKDVADAIEKIREQRTSRPGKLKRQQRNSPSLLE